MIHFSYTGQGETLCGEPQLEADLKDGPVCNECIHVMWNEQYRRNTLRRVKIEDTQEEEQERGHLRDDSHRSPLYLSAYERET